MKPSPPARRQVSGGRPRPGEVRRAFLLEFRQPLFVVAFDPAGRRVVDLFIGGIDSVLGLQARHRHVELEDADGAEDVVVAEERPEDLDRPLLGELGEPLPELLDLERVLDPDPPEVLRGEIGDPGEPERLPLGEGVADPDRPWLWIPMMSPGQASSTFVRSWAMKIVALEITISRPIRWWNTFIPRVNFPEQIRKKAIRSRWARSMFAWILKTKPEKVSSRGDTIRVVAAAGRAGSKLHKILDRNGWM